MNTSSATNKRIAADFLDTMFNRHAVDEGIERYVGNTYRQHNPGVPDGVEGFRAYFHRFFAEFPESGLEIKRLLCEGDLVTVHLHWWKDAGDPGSAVMDIFRLETGRIVEHWDVVQPIPGAPANQNSMF
jgi:predicted SnoaL-like aldol condensation-catalyzing enzyme